MTTTSTASVTAAVSGQLISPRVLSTVDVTVAPVPSGSGISIQPGYVGAEVWCILQTDPLHRTVTIDVEVVDLLADYTATIGGVPQTAFAPHTDKTDLLVTWMGAINSSDLVTCTIDSEERLVVRAIEEAPPTILVTVAGGSSTAEILVTREWVGGVMRIFARAASAMYLPAITDERAAAWVIGDAGGGQPAITVVDGLGRRMALSVGGVGDIYPYLSGLSMVPGEPDDGVDGQVTYASRGPLVYVSIGTAGV